MMVALSSTLWWVKVELDFKWLVRRSKENFHSAPGSIPVTVTRPHGRPGGCRSSAFSIVLRGWDLSRLALSTVQRPVDREYVPQSRPLSGVTRDDP
jgi:hypothetical protein